MTTGRINQVSTSALAPPTAEAVNECGRMSASSGGTVNSRRSPEASVPIVVSTTLHQTKRRRGRNRKTNSTEAPPPSEHGSRRIHALRLRNHWDVPLDTHTSSLLVARAEQADDGHGQTPRTRRTARHDRTRTAPRPRGKRQWKSESRAHGFSPHSATGQPVRGLPRSNRPAAAGQNHSPTFPDCSQPCPKHPGAELRNPESPPCA